MWERVEVTSLKGLCDVPLAGKKVNAFNLKLDRYKI